MEISWNHVEFEVRYECLSEEIKIGRLSYWYCADPLDFINYSLPGDYYLRLLLDEGGSTKIVKAYVSYTSSSFFFFFSVSLSLCLSLSPVPSLLSSLFHVLSLVTVSFTCIQTLISSHLHTTHAYPFTHAPLHIFSAEFFNDLYHRFLLSPKPNMKAMCLQAMAIVYGQCYEEIGPFNDTEFVVRKLALVGGKLK